MPAPGICGGQEVAEWPIQPTSDTSRARRGNRRMKLRRLAARESQNLKSTPKSVWGDLSESNALPWRSPEL